MDHLQSLRSLIQAQGGTTNVELALDGGKQLTVLVSAGGQPKRAFSIASRPEGVFILGFKGCFRIEDHADAARTITQLTHQVITQADSALDLRGLSLESYSYQKWLDDGRQRASAERSASGWTLIADRENERVWEAYTRRFSFRISTSRDDGPVITELPPFVTWSVEDAQQVYESDKDQFQSLERLSQEQFLRALCDIGFIAAQMYALDLNHDGYSFEPPVIARRGIDTCPVPLIPVHNFSLFADPTFSIGLFGNPYEASICVFGDLLVKQVALRPLACFGEVIRSSTHSRI